MKGHIISKKTGRVIFYSVTIFKNFVTVDSTGDGISRWYINQMGWDIVKGEFR